MTVGIIEGVTNTLGEELTELAGALVTRLTSPLLPEQLVQTDLNNADVTAGEAATALAVDCTWDGTLTVLCSDTTGVVAGKYARLDSDGQPFEIASFAANVSITLLNPGGLTIPTGTGPTSQLVPSEISLTSGGFIAAVVAGLRFRVTSGTQIDDSAIINTVDSSTALTLRTALSIPPTGLTGESWEVVIDAETTAQVESTLGWPTSGFFYLDGILYRFSGIATGEIQGLEHYDGAFFQSGAKQEHTTLAEVVDFTRDYSALDEYRRSFLVDYATGEDLNVVGANVGVPRPPELEDDDLYRALIKATAYAPRATVYAIELALDALLGETLIQSSDGDIASASGTVVTIVAGTFDASIEEGYRFRIKTDGDLLDETVLIKERLSSSQIRLQSTRLGDFSRLEWEITKKNWEVFEDLTLGSINHPAKVYVTQFDESTVSSDSEGRTFLENQESTTIALAQQVSIDTPFIRAASIVLKNEGWDDWYVAEGSAATSVDSGLTVTGPASTFPASIQPGDIFQLTDSLYAGARAIVEQRVSDTQLDLGILEGGLVVNSNEDGSIGFNFSGASWKVFRNRSNVLWYKPSAETVIDYPGDAGTTLWTFDGNNETTQVLIQTGGPGYGQVMIISGSGNIACYKRTARIHPSSYVQLEAFLDATSLSTTQANAMQAGMVISDGMRSVLVGAVDDGAGSVDVGFVDEMGAFIGTPVKWSGVSGTTYTPGFNNLLVKKFGEDRVQLWSEAFDDNHHGDGLQLVDEIAYSSLPTTAAWQGAAGYTAGTHEIAYGHMTAVGTVNLYYKFIDWTIRTGKDFWNTEIPNASTAASGQLSDNDTNALHESGDVGKLVRIYDWTTLNSGDGNPRGLWEIDTFTDADNIEVTGPTEGRGYFTLLNTDHLLVREGPNAFRWPDHKGHSVEILTGANAGIYPILAIVDPESHLDVETDIPDTAADAGNWVGPDDIPFVVHSSEVKLDPVAGTPSRAEFVPETEEVEWRLIPNFAVDAGPVSYEILDTGEDLGGGTLETRTPMGYAIGTVVSVGRSRVLTGQLLDEEDINALSGGVYANHPFYLFDNFGYVRDVIDLLTAAGVFVEFESFSVDDAGPHILE